jgi:hypothetical protein
MTLKTLCALVLAALAFFVGHVGYAADGNSGECNIYCRNVILVQNCLPRFSVFLEFNVECCTGCEGNGTTTTFCVDAVDTRDCAVFRANGMMFRGVDASSQCPCGNGKTSTDAQNSSNPETWLQADWRTCGGVNP